MTALGDGTTTVDHKDPLISTALVKAATDAGSEGAKTATGLLTRALGPTADVFGQELARYAEYRLRNLGTIGAAQRRSPASPDEAVACIRASLIMCSINLGTAVGRSTAVMYVELGEVVKAMGPEDEDRDIDDVFLHAIVGLQRQGLVEQQYASGHRDPDSPTPHILSS